MTTDGATGERLVRVAVAAQADRPERTFSYRLPPWIQAEAGSLLLVPYGRRQALGYLMPGPAIAPDTGLREVTAVVSEPMLSVELLRLAEDVAVYYRAPLGETLAAMLPPGLESRIERRWRPAPDAPPEFQALAEDDGSFGDTAYRRLVVRLGRGVVERARREGRLVAAWHLQPARVTERRTRMVERLVHDGVPRGAVQRAILDALEVGRPEALSAVADRIGRPAATLLEPVRALEAAGRVRLGWTAAPREPLAHRAARPGPSEALANEQTAAVEVISALAAGGCLLLEGIAASGKTEVYLAATKRTVAAGRSAILLVPELSLIPQMADRLRATFGERVGTLHSGLSAGERHDEWWRIQRGEADVVLGTRGAVFAPLANLGLIVLDEAHDDGYKGERTPRFDARWVARRRAELTGARVVLGTATPDLVLLEEVRRGHVTRFGLRERRVGLAPRIEVVDLRAELSAGNRSVLSAALADGLAALEVGREQAILLINRRGAATFVLCRDCGQAVSCPDCGLPYVHHLSGDTLRCHHCGRRAPVPQACPTCRSPRIRYFGAGTQRVEAEVRTRFPGLRVGRLDSDTMDRRRGFEAIYDDFREGRLDVLVGTQLAAKGLDVPTVTLVAVVAADVTLHLPDFRAAERTFQMVAQVAGRAGRGPRPGRVIVQTYAPDHPAITAAVALDPDAFAASERPRRQVLGYPPFSQLARLFIADPDRMRGEARAQAAAEAVRIDGVEVNGPLPSWVPRRAGRWRWQIVIRAATRQDRQTALERVPAGIGIDVDPESLL